MLPKISIKRPVTTVMIVLIVMLTGIIGYKGLKMDLMPSVNIPVAVVSVTYPGAGPEEVENLISKPIEEALATVSNVDEISSVSNDGYSVIIVTFVDGTDLDFSALDMREKVDLVKGTLPESASDPIVLKIDMSMMSSIIVGVSSESMDFIELSQLLEDNVVKRLEKIEGVASASLMGNAKKEVEIIINQEKAMGYGVTTSQISSVLAAENTNYPAGTLTQGTTKLTLRSAGEFKSIEEIRQMPMLTPTGAYIHLSDVASVNEIIAETKSYSLIDGQPSVLISMQKQSNANIVEVSKRINRELSSIGGDYPQIKAIMLTDTSSYIEKSMNNVLTTAIQATVMAVIVLLIFLRDTKTSAIIGVSIPTSVISTFAMMYLLDMTLNIISLGGIAIGIGMFVDNSIVVLENIHRHFQMGKDAKTAAFDGCHEVSMSITASTLTTVAVFIPMMFIKGITGEMFQDLSLTVTFSLMASLLVSLTFVPMACAFTLKRSDGAGKKPRVKLPAKLGKFLDSVGRGVDMLDEKYRRILTYSLDNKKKIATTTIAVFIGSLCLIPIMGVDFMPPMDQGSATMTIALPSGSVLEETEAVVNKILEKVEDIPETEVAYVMAGGSSMSYLTGGDTSTATINFNFVRRKDRTRSTDEIVLDMKKRVSDVAGAEIEISSNSFAMGDYGGSSVELYINGDDNDELRRIGEEVAEMAAGVKGVTKAESSGEDVVPEANIVINRTKAGLYGITAAAVAGAVNTAVTGDVATQYRVDGSEIDVVIRQDKDKVQYVNDLRNITINTAEGAAIPLTDVAEIVIKDSNASITRHSSKKYVTVTGEVSGRDTQSVKKDIQAIMDNYEMPEGYEYSFGGILEMMSDSYQSLGIVLIVAVLLVYMIMASQFESLVHPFIVLFSVPLALTGGIAGLFIAGQSITVTAFLGFIMLVGMVVNNAIVLIDYTNQLRETGLSVREALLVAGPTRLKPILMTTLTTIMGLVPMALAIGEGTEMQQPMALTVIFGLLISTIVTLVFVPIVYSYVDAKREKSRLKRRGETEAAEQ